MGMGGGPAGELGHIRCGGGGGAAGAGGGSGASPAAQSARRTECPLRVVGSSARPPRGLRRLMAINTWILPDAFGQDNVLFFWM
jgi:hypothetical protein